MAKREIKFYKHYFNEFYVAQTENILNLKNQKAKCYGRKQKRSSYEL